MSDPATAAAGVDLTPLVQAVISLAATTLAAVGGLALNALRQKYNLQISSDRQDAWEQALDNAIQYGAQASTDVIASKGWNHIDSHNAVVNAGLYYITTHAPATLKAVGLSNNLADPANKQKIEEALQRVLPSGLARAALSPATPPANAPQFAHGASAPPPQEKPMATKVSHP